MSKLKIQVLHYTTHMHYGGDRTISHTFNIGDGKQAEMCYNNIEKRCPGSNGYEHCSIRIIFETMVEEEG